MIVEVCAGSLKDCIVAQKHGATRIELNSALHLGGLTTSLATLILAKKQVELPIICMVRPRGAGFDYDEYEQEVMFLDAELLLKNGADGIAFGFLNTDKTINRELTTKMIQLIHRYGKEAVFHRAFDCVDNVQSSIELLIELGCDRILTSGLANGAPEGKQCLADLQKQYGNRIQLCMGAGINADNIVDLVKITNIKQCHASFKCWQADNTTSGNQVSYRYGELDAYDEVSPDKLEALLTALKGE